MAILRTHLDGTDGCALELSSAEYETIRRALYKARERALEMGASADLDGIERLLKDLGR